MALAGNSLPFGLRQVKISPYTTAGAIDTANAVLLPASRTFEFSDTEDFETLEGNDTTVASHGSGPIVEFSLEGGGISLLLWKLLAGGTVAASGTSPAALQTFSKLNTDSRPYFQVEGRSISDNGGDFHATVPYCKADGDLEANQENGSFLLTSASGHGYGDPTSGSLYNFTRNETAIAIV